MRSRPHIILIFLLAYFTNYAQVKYSTIANGSWNNASTWDNGIPPSTLSQSDTVYINHEVILNATQIILGVLVIDSSGQLNNSAVDLFIGKNAQNKGELFNYGAIVVNKLDVSPNGCNSNDTKPVGYNFGDITCTQKIHIGKNCGSGFFYNYLGSNVNLGTELHLDAYLCNEDTIVVQNRIYNHGGTIECCGFFVTPNVESNDNEGRPGTYLCSNFCTDQQTQPVFEVDNSNYLSFADALSNAPSNHLTYDTDSTLTCDYNSFGNYVDLSTCFIDLAQSQSSPLCLGDSIIISIDSSSQSLASSAISWNTGQTSSSVSFSPTATTIYTVSINDGTQTCMESIQVEVVPNPVVSAGSDQTVCSGDSVSLVGSGSPPSNLGSLLFSSTQNINSPWNLSWTVDSNQYYILEVSGIYGISFNTLNCYDPAFVFCSGNNNGNQLNGCDNLSSLGSNFARWVYQDDCYIRPDTNVYKTNHNYYYTILSDGSIDLSFIDTDYSDNSGSISFNLYKQEYYSWDYGVTDGVAFSPLVGSLNYTLTCTGNYGCTGTDQVTVTVSDASFDLQSVYCSNQGNILPFNVLDTSGYFSSSTGSLNFIDSITGLIDVLSLDTVFYRIYHNVSVCTDSIDFQLVSSDFSYPFSQYCDGDSLAQPFISGNQAGVFSSNLSPQLALNNQGGIDISSSYDTSYTIFYNVMGCVDSFALEIISDEFSYPSSSYCVGGVNPFPVIEGSSGGVFSADSPLLISSSTGEISLLNAIDTSYTIYYDLLSCRDSFSLIVLSAAFAYDSIFYCNSSSDPSPQFLGSPNGVFSSSSTLAIDSLSGLISLQNSLDTLHAIYYQIGSCIDTFNLALINPSFTYLDTTFCFGETVDTVVLNGSNCGFFSISPADVSIDSSSGVINFASASSSIYTVSHFLGGCSSDFSLSVENPTFSYIDSIYCSYDDPDSALYASNAGTFSSFPLGISFVDVNSGLIDFNSSSDMSYSILHTVGECVDTFDLTVVNVNGNGFYADSVCGLAYQVDQSLINEVSYLWNTLDTGLVFSSDTIFNPIVSVSSQGIYFFDCSLSKKGCIYSDSIELKFVDSIYLSLQNELVVNQSSVELLANSNAYFYQWENVSLNEGNIESPFTANTLISNLITGDYTFGITASNDICPDAYGQIELFVDWIFIPNGFSPNGDGINDNFGLDGARQGVVFELQIFNRWGELVYASSDFFDKWDGTIFGKEAPEDTYFYFIELSGVRYKGSLELRR